MGQARSAGILLVLVALVLGPLSNQGFAQQPQDGQGVLIDQVLTEIQSALSKVQKDLAFEKIPPLQSVTLDLVVEVKKEVGAKINLYVVTFGKKWERDRSQEVEITLKPPSPGAPTKAGKGPSVSEELVNAIESAAKGVQRARNDKDVPLETSGLKFVLSFVVKGDTSGGVKFEIAPVTVDLSGDLANSATQKITIIYQNAATGKK